MDSVSIFKGMTHVTCCAETLWGLPIFAENMQIRLISTKNNLEIFISGTKEQILSN